MKGIISNMNIYMTPRWLSILTWGAPLCFPQRAPQCHHSATLPWPAGCPRRPPGSSPSSPPCGWPCPPSWQQPGQPFPPHRTPSFLWVLAGTWRWGSGAWLRGSSPGWWTRTGSSVPPPPASPPPGPPPPAPCQLPTTCRCHLEELLGRCRPHQEVAVLGPGGAVVLLQPQDCPFLLPLHPGDGGVEPHIQPLHLVNRAETTTHPNDQTRLDQ